jgi:autotransporter-associated beta strand protein
MLSGIQNRQSRSAYRVDDSFVGRRMRLKVYAQIAAVLACVSFAGAASAALPGVTDNSWTGTVNNLWSVAGNWSLGHTPTSSEAVRFDQLSTQNLSINNDLVGVSISGFANTALAANNGPTGPITITGNAITIGATGIIMGSGTPADPFGYTGPAQVNITVDVDLALSANQDWKDGGPGTTSTAQPGGEQAIIVGASPNGRTVSLNGFTPTFRIISNTYDWINVNSKLVDGSAVSSVAIGRLVATGGSVNTNPRIRISGDNTYSGGTNIAGARQLIQLNTSSVTNQSGNILSGPLGTGVITETNEPGTDQTPFLVAWGADRTLHNPITLNGTLNFAASLDDTAQHTLTLGGNITVPANASLLLGNGKGVISTPHVSGDNYRNGSGDVIINGNVLLTSLSGTLTAGQGGAAPSAGVVVGKMVFNGNIQQTQPSGSYSLAITGSATGSAAVPTAVQLFGQNTYANTALSATGGSSPTANANLGIGSSTILDGGGNIVSGPVGLGTLTVSGATATGSSVEALGGARTVANIVNISTAQSTMVVQGSNDLTLTGTVTGAGSLTKNGTAKLILSNATNDYLGATTVNSGTLLVNGSLTGNGGVTVGAAGTLGGTGSITGAITNNGTIAPGASIGTLSVTGDVSFNSGSTFNVEVNGTSNTSDLLAVTGNLSLSGASLAASLLAGSLPTGPHTIATYTGTLTGTFTAPSGISVNYGTGTNSQITITINSLGLPGDFNSDGKVDAGDYVTWRKNNGTNNALANDNGLGVPVGPAHYNLWRANFGNPPGAGSGGNSLGAAGVPEPAGLVLAVLGLIVGSAGRYRSRGNCR